MRLEAFVIERPIAADPDLTLLGWLAASQQPAAPAAAGPRIPCHYPATLSSENLSIRTNFFSVFANATPFLSLVQGFPSRRWQTRTSVFHAWVPPTLKQHSPGRPAPRALPLPKAAGQRISAPGDEWAPAYLTLSPLRFSPVLFTHPDQDPSAAASDLVSFGGSNDGEMDDSLSLAASDAEELSGPYHDHTPLHSAQPSASSPGMDADLFHVLSNTVEELDLEWSPPEEPSCSRLMEWFLPGHRQAPCQWAYHQILACTLHASSSSALTSVDGAEEKGYDSLPPLDESAAAHLCPPTAIGWKAKAAPLSKQRRMTPALTGRAYSSVEQAASALHSMAILQVFQAKLLCSMDESNPNPAAFNELHSATDLALRATKMTAQAIGRSMASLVVLERHLWLNLTKTKDADKVPFLDSPVSPTGLFCPEVEGFTAAQKSS